VNRRPRLGWARLVTVAVVLVGLPALGAGCAFESQIAVEFSPASPAVVKESSNPQLTLHRVHGVTARPGQVVGIDCSVSIIYDVLEATGSAVLVQLYRVHLHSRPLPRGTAYRLDCTGPLIMELPTDASNVAATSTSAAGQQLPLPVQAPVTSVPTAFGKRLRAEPGMQLAVVGWPPTLSPGDYRVELAFGVPQAHAIREKALYTASISCGRSSYLQPILPLTTRMARVPAFTIQPSADATSFSVPHIIPANRTYAETQRMLSCAR
jgi:hypothetical protein